MKIIKLLLLIIIIGLIFGCIFIGSIYMCWIPVPKYITSMIAHKKGLSDKESDKMNNIVNVYQILKKSNNEELKQVEKVLLSGQSPKDGVLISKIYNNISDETLTKIGKQLDMDSIDFYKAKKILKDTCMTH